MLFYINYEGQEYKVRVESRDGQYQVKFQDEPEVPVDLSYYGNDYTLIHDNDVFSANIVGSKSDYTVWRPQGNLHFSVESEYRRIVGLLRGQSLQVENNVYAKMPGKITKIQTKVGNTVAAGDSLMVKEAMKMENEIRSQIAGTVKNILVKEGQAVENGTMLIEISPEE